MLSNKLTFSLASLVVLLIIGLCLPVDAQKVSEAKGIALDATADDATFDHNRDGDTTDDGEAEGKIPAGGFIVYGNNETALPGVRTATLPYVRYEPQAIANDNGIPDLEEFLRFGGTIELVVGIDSPIDWHELVISEIMWALDDALDDDTDAQWIELYNAKGKAIDLTTDTVYVIFTPFGRSVNNRINDDATDNDNVAAAITLAKASVIEKAADDKDGRPEKDTFTYTHKVIDRVSNIELDDNLRFRSRWPAPGQNGVSALPTQDANINEFTPAISPLISMSRTITYGLAKGGVPAGHEVGSWVATDALGRRNTISNTYQASPGAGLNPVEYALAGATAAPPADMIVINEVRNSTDPDLEWIEIKNVTAPGTDPIQIENWQVSRYDKGKKDAITGAPKDEVVIADLPKYKLGPQEILLIVNRDPSETELAGGVDLDILIDTNKEQLQKGATHQYIVRDTLVLPDNGNFLLLLRTATDKNNTDELIHDAVGELQEVGYTTDRTAHTEVLPFKNYVAIADADRVDAMSADSNHTAWSRIPKGVKAGHYIVENTNGRATGAWHKVSGTGAFEAAWATAGVGYDREVDLDFSPGTPGYENMIANTVDDYVSTQPDPDGMEYQGMISISEIMFDAGPRWNLIQWIELYNNSMTQTVDLTGWELEIRNAKEDVESYVDSVFTFVEEGRAVILPNQTLLIVSGGGTNDVPNERVYNLYEHHRRALGLTTRRSVLLSPTGFYIKLTDRKDLDRDSRADQDVIVDEAGNVMVDGAARHIQWALPDVEANDVRKSIVRQYGQRYTPQGGNDPDNIRYQPAGGEAPNTGNPTTAEVEGSPNGANDFWRESDIVGAGISFYGHRDDISTPGYRTGGPLPVSLSSFRPERDKTTGEVVIRWITQSELNNAGFNILRAESKDGTFEVVNLTGIIAGHGTTSEKHVYTYTDKTAKPNVAYYYQIEDVSLNGHRTTLETTHMRGNVSAGGKLTTRWSELKSSGK